MDSATNHEAITSGSMVTIAGNFTNGWGVGNAIANYFQITMPKDDSIIFWAGTNVTTMTNYADISGTKYVNGAEAAWDNVYYTNSGTTYYWFTNGGALFGGVIDDIIAADTGFDATDYVDYYNEAKDYLGWN